MRYRRGREYSSNGRRELLPHACDSSLNSKYIHTYTSKQANKAIPHNKYNSLYSILPSCTTYMTQKNSLRHHNLRPLRNSYPEALLSYLQAVKGSPAPSHAFVPYVHPTIRPHMHHNTQQAHIVHTTRKSQSSTQNMTK